MTSFHKLMMFAGLTAAITTSVIAAPGPDREGRVTPRERLGLSESQEQQLKELRLQHKRDAVRRQADLKIARLDLQELMSAPTLDERAITAKVKQLGALQSAAFEARMQARLEAQRLLTPEQRQKMRDMRQHRGDKMKGRRFEGRRPHRPQGGFGGGERPPQPFN